MQVDKKQIPQFIILGVLVLFCVGYVSFKVLSPKDSAPPAPANQAAVQDNESNAVEGDPALASVSIDPLPAGVFPDITSVPSRRDPFAPQVLPNMESTDNQARPVQTPRVNPMPRPALRSGNPWAKIQPVQPIPSFSQGNAPVVVQKVEDLDPKFILTGVVRGEENVAIIRVGEKGRYIVKQGQLVEGRYRVLSVTSDGAVLANKDRRISLNLGGVN